MPTFKWSPFGLGQKLKNISPYSVVGVFFGAAALISIAFGMLTEEPTWIIRKLLSGYHLVITFIFRWLVDWWFPALIKKIAGLVGWRIEIFPHWRDVVALLTLYVSSHVRQALAENVPNRAIATMIRSLAGTIGLVLAVAAASVSHASGLPQIVSILAACLIGIATYRIGFAAQFAFDLRGSGFRSHFRDKVSGVVTIALGGMIILLLALFTLRISVPQSILGLQVIFVFLFVLFLGAYHVWTAVYSDWSKHRQLSADARERISVTGHYNIGVRILWAWAGAVAVVLSNGLY